MWYLSWLLGMGGALAFGVINGMWFESRRPLEAGKQKAR